MRHPGKGGGRAAAFTDPVLDAAAGTGSRPAARPAPGCPLRAAALAAEPPPAPPSTEAGAAAEPANVPAGGGKPPAGTLGDRR
ncbi:hypothetical protein F8568_029135 [Actinomadura sp. LD22]|uniref:Uncharacterized protein n=1 Tax=Actinomadura physcomitrii TaxID=2650748 RepID=A0A6I4MF51_9ACTN|nr:hypothetical protein [Actinomadura physcomitrii]MWA04372.1 hypothetical protein [Actinomadura physcomitrii]